MHGPSFRMFQYTGSDEVSTWVYKKNTHRLRTKGAHYAEDGILEIPYEKAVVAFAGSDAPEMFVIEKEAKETFSVLVEFLITASQAVGRSTRKHEVTIAKRLKTRIDELLSYDEPVMNFAASAEELQMERVRITGVSVETTAPVVSYVKVGDPAGTPSGARSQRITSPPHSDDNASRDTSCPRDPSCDEDMQEGDGDRLDLESQLEAEADPWRSILDADSPPVDVKVMNWQSEHVSSIGDEVTSNKVPPIESIESPPDVESQDDVDRIYEDSILENGHG
jgi:hypothetical protein